MSSNSGLITSISPLVDASGFTTNFVPLTSDWSAVPGCESSFWASIYTSGTYLPSTITSTVSGFVSTITTSSFSTFFNTSLFAYDPKYGASAEVNLACLPPEVTETYSTTTTAKTLKWLGPLKCPGGYSTAFTTPFATSSQLLVCCPSGYGFNGISPNGYWGECISTMPANEAVTYAYLSPTGTNTAGSTIGVTTFATGTLPSPTTVYALAVKGIAAQLILSGTTTGPTSPSTTGGTGSPSNNGVGGGRGMDSSTKIAVGVGVSLGILLLIAIGVGAYCFGTYRRRRLQHRYVPQEIYPEAENTYYPK